MAAAAAAFPRGGWAAGETLKIGVLNDMNGVFADYQGAGSVLATQMAVEDANGRAGSRTVEVLSGDHQNKPDTGMTIVRRWLDQDGVDVVMDVPNSSIALAVQQFATDRNKLFIGVGAGTADLTGPRCTANTLHWDYDTWETSQALGRAITQRGGKTWFTVAADYAFGADLDRNISAAVTASGGRVIGGVKGPSPLRILVPSCCRPRARGAQVLALNNAGDDTTVSLKQAAEFGLNKSMQVCGPVYNINITKGVGLAVAQGVLGVTPFYWDRDEGTRAFSRRYATRSKNHAMPNDMQAGMYSATAHLLKAVAAGADPADGRALTAAMKAMPTEDPIYGPGSIRADGRKLHPVYLFTTKSPAESTGGVGHVQDPRHHPTRPGLPAHGGWQLPAREELSFRVCVSLP